MNILELYYTFYVALRLFWGLNTKIANFCLPYFKAVAAPQDLIAD